MKVNQAQPSSPIKESPPPVSWRARQRQVPKSRFKGFDHSSDSDNDGDDATQVSAAPRPDNATSQSQPLGALSRSQRKRPAPERDIMDEVAPTAAAIKRMRLEAGEDPLPAAPTPPPPSMAQAEAPKSPQKGKAKGRTAGPAKKGKKGAAISDEDFLNQFLAEGQEEEANLRAERELLQRELAEGTIDFEDIRQGIAVETVEVRRPQGVPRQGNQDERWDPRWNGLRNFKKFGRQGRQQPRNIIPLEPVKAKEYAIGGDYWLEKRSGKHAKSQEATQIQTQNRSQASNNQVAPRDDSEVEEGEFDEGPSGSGRARHSFSPPDIMDLEPTAAAPASAPSRSRKGKAAEKASQTVRVPTRGRGGRGTQQKRTAAEPLAAEKPAKRARATRSMRQAAENSDEGQDGEEDEDDSEGEGLNFRFGKRK